MDVVGGKGVPSVWVWLVLLMCVCIVSELSGNKSQYSVNGSVCDDSKLKVYISGESVSIQPVCVYLLLF